MNNVTVLYIEDNLDNRILMRRILQSEGYQVIEAENAEGAMQAIENFHPDLILMDINLPEVDGYSLTKHLKKNPAYHRVPIIALTANVMRGDRELTLEAGCDGYIEKPIDVDNITDQIGYFVNQRGST